MPDENLVHRVVEGADHRGVEVAELVLVVAHVLLVAVRHLEKKLWLLETESNFMLRFQDQKQGQILLPLSLK